MSKCFSTRSRALRTMADLRSSSAASDRMALARAHGSRGGTSTPYNGDEIIWVGPPRLVAMAGIPDALAPSNTISQGSFQDGAKNQAGFLKKNGRATETKKS